MMILAIIISYFSIVFLFAFLNGYFKWNVEQELIYFWPMTLVFAIVLSPLFIGRKLTDLGKYYSRVKLDRLFYEKNK